MARDEKRNLIEQHEKYFCFSLIFMFLINWDTRAYLSKKKMNSKQHKKRIRRREENACRILSHRFVIKPTIQVFQDVILALERIFFMYIMMDVSEVKRLLL